jgi:GNAT superfamily N-acetyltransferase
METEYPIEYLDEPAWDVIGGGISEFNRRQAGDDHPKRLCFVVRAPGGEIAGGLIGVTYWDWLYIDLLWLKEDLRGKGYGHRLMLLAEEEGRKRGAKHAYLDTFSFQAPDFYTKHGYHVFGELQNFPAGHTRFFFTKDL